MVKFDVAPSNCLGGEFQCMKNVQEPPQINVTFPDKSKDNLELTHHRLNDESPIGCNYLGHLRGSRISIVAVTGCLDKPADKMEVTMFSQKAQNKMYTVDYNGKTEPIKGAFEDGGLHMLNFNIFSCLYQI